MPEPRLSMDMAVECVWGRLTFPVSSFQFLDEPPGVS